MLGDGMEYWIIGIMECWGVGFDSVLVLGSCEIGLLRSIPEGLHV